MVLLQITIKLQSNCVHVVTILFIIQMLFSTAIAKSRLPVCVCMYPYLTICLPVNRDFIFRINQRNFDAAIREARVAQSHAVAQRNSNMKTSGGNKKGGHSKAHRDSCSVHPHHATVIRWPGQMGLTSTIQFAYATVKCSCELCLEK